MKKQLIALFALFAIATSAFAGGSSPGGWVDGNSLMAGGFGSSSGGYDANGGGWNNGTGEIVARGSFAESGGAFKGNFSFNGTTCNDGPCASFAQGGGEGSALQRSGSFFETNGGDANSAVNGNAYVGGESFANSWKQPAYGGRPSH